MVRCFEDENVAHVEGAVDPRRDVEIIETELLLADLDTVSRRIAKQAKAAQAGDKEAQAGRLPICEPINELLSAGKPARGYRASPEDEPIFAELGLLTAKARPLYRQHRRKEHPLRQPLTPRRSRRSPKSGTPTWS